MTQDRLNEIIQNHRLWLMGEGGSRADLRGADLSDTYLSDADLSGAKMDKEVDNGL